MRPPMCCGSGTEKVDFRIPVSIFLQGSVDCDDEARFRRSGTFAGFHLKQQDAFLEEGTQDVIGHALDFHERRRAQLCVRERLAYRAIQAMFRAPGVALHLCSVHVTVTRALRMSPGCRVAGDAY
jgi:hypothetical protein